MEVTIPMKDALIVSAVRTPVGRAGGALAEVRPDDLAAVAVRAAVDRVSFDPAQIDDVILGCTNQAGEDNRNVARMAVLLAGLPIEVPGQTVNRLCGSGLQAIASAAQAIKAGEGNAFVAGGVESMTRAPYVQLKSGSPWNREVPAIADSTVGWRFTNPRMNKEWTISARHDRREGREAVWHLARGAGRIRAREPETCGRRHRAGLFQRRDRRRSRSPARRAIQSG